MTEKLKRGKVADLTPAPYNPRKITDKQLKMLKKSLLEFGDLSGIVVNVRTGNICGGHQRIKTLDPEWRITAEPHEDKTGTVAHGWIQTPEGRLHYREVDWTLKKEQMANIAANQHGGIWDIPQLKSLLVDIDVGDVDMELTGFDDLELKAMFDFIPGVKHATPEERLAAFLSNDPTKEWIGMPEFNNIDKMSFRFVIVHFENADNVAKFFSIIGQDHTDKTKSIWFPAKERKDTQNRVYKEK